MDALSSLNDALAGAVDRAAPSVVQVQGRRRPVAGVVFAPDLVIAPVTALSDDDGASVRVAGGRTHEGTVLGRAYAVGLAVVRVEGLGIAPLEAADEPRVGHLAIAVGRTWSGGVMAAVTNVAVLGGPLRTGRSGQLDRVIRIAQPPHGALSGGALIDGAGRALGVVTGAAIRDTTVVVPATIAWAAGQQIAREGGIKQGYLGITSTTVTLPEGQRGGRQQSHGLLVSGIAEGSPAAAAGLLVGDVIIAFDGTAVDEPQALVELLRGDRIGRPATVTLLRGGTLLDVQVTVGERQRR
jgi:S1-C subfamily serine protease